MATKKFMYKGNLDAHDTTEILEVGSYAATQGQTLPVTQAVYEQIHGRFDLTPVDDKAAITATKVNDHEDLKELVGDLTDESKTDPLVTADPEGSSSSSDGNLKGGTGSGGGK